MKAEYNKWYKCQEEQMPEDFENVVRHNYEERTRDILVQTIYTDNYNEGICMQYRYDCGDKWRWQPDLEDEEVLAWKLPAPYKED